MPPADTPFALRGLMQDFGRGQTPTLATMKRTVERLAELGLNTYFPYFEDGFHFPRRPEIGAERDRVTPAEAAELVAHAREHGVRVIPVIETLGHMENILSASGLDSLRMGAEGQARNVVDPRTDEARALVADMLADMADAFDDPVVHVGLDETFGLEAAAQQGDDPGALFVEHVQRVRDLAAARGRRVMVWADQLEPGFFDAMRLPSFASDRLHEIPRDVVIVSWHYGEMRSFPFGERVRELGFDHVLWGAVDHESKVFPDLGTTDRNARTYFGLGHDQGVLGAVASAWERPGEYVLFDVDWPGVAIAAACMKSTQPGPMEDIVRSWAATAFGDEAGAATAVADAVLVLGRVASSFEWGGGLFRSGDWKQFYRPFEHAPLDDETLERVEALGRDLAGCRIPRVDRNEDIAEAIDLSLDQAVLLVDLVLARHAGVATNELASRVRDFRNRFAAAWLRRNKPLALAAMAQRLTALEQSILTNVG